MTPTDVACPKCGMGQGQKCRTLKTSRVTGTHEARRVQMHRALVERLADEPECCRRAGRHVNGY
jgi:hypothetical protein